MRKQPGFTLIELIIFIVIVGIVGTAILVGIHKVLENTPKINYQSIATEAASKCLEGYLGERYLQGYSAISSDSTPAFCSAPTGYTMTETVTNTTMDGEASYKTITVTVTGKGNASLSLLVADY